METKLKRAHITLMRHPETALYAGCMMMGTTEITDAVATACTDGINKKYGRAFLSKLSDAEVRALVLHENLHVALRHCIHGRAMQLEDRARAAQAADYVVNDIIVNLKDKSLCKLPEGGLVSDKYHDWSMREIFDGLKEECEGKKPPPPEPPEDGEGEGEGEGESPEGDAPEDGGDKPGDKPGEPKEHGGFDTHEFDEPMDADEQKEVNEKVDRALREGALLAGRLGADIPRVISDMMEPKVDWREALREFITSNTKGKDEFTWRQFNRRQIANDIYLPTVEDETIGELIVAIDTSGSIGQEQINEFATELMSICETVQPDMVRVLWWDTRVAGEQLFTDKDYTGLAALLKPQGGGGTHVGSVSSHILKEDLKADCIVVFTDGYVESNIVWETTIPTLWMVTMCRGLVVPVGGKLVMFE